MGGSGDARPTQRTSRGRQNFDRADTSGALPDSKTPWPETLQHDDFEDGSLGFEVSVCLRSNCRNDLEIVPWTNVTVFRVSALDGPTDTADHCQNG